MEKLWLMIIFFTFFMHGFGDSEKSEISPSDLNFKFTLYNRNHTKGIKLTPGDKAELIASGFKGSLPSKVIVHGFLNNENATWIKRVKEGDEKELEGGWNLNSAYGGDDRQHKKETSRSREILKIEEANVIIFDWSSCAKNVLYIEVVECINVTSRYLGNFIKFLEKDGDLNLEKTYLIGHSLGAQILGIAMSIYPPKTIGRITGLDPAGPMFEDVDETERLNPSRAKIVDVIHTCIYFVGMKKPVGTLDFYPNGGFNQPACGSLDLGCQHRQSHHYFIDSFKNRNKYVAQKCESLRQALRQNCTGVSGPMGYFLGNSPPGIYHLKVK